MLCSFPCKSSSALVWRRSFPTYVTCKPCVDSKTGSIYVEFFESNGEATYTPINLSLVQIREDDQEQPILTTNLGNIGNNRSHSAEIPRVISAIIYLHACKNDVLKESRQVIFNRLACRNHLRFFRPGGHIPHNRNHERFDSFLQFPDLLFDRCGVLVKVYSFRLPCTSRIFICLPRTPQ